METFIKKFEQMGARAKHVEVPEVLRNRAGIIRHTPGVQLDIKRDRIGVFYHIQTIPSAELLVLDVQPKYRHLLLMVKTPEKDTGTILKDKFLCGHDERDWFIAQVPEDRPVSSVITAKEALKPQMVLDSQNSVKLSTKNKHRRHNEAFLRQGEWFFIPAPNVVPPKWTILHNEPLIRGRGKPHTAEHLFRIGGTTVYVSHQYRNGLTEEEYRQLMQTDGGNTAATFSVRQRDPDVYVQGRITHADHKTLHLDTWHRVMPNTETAGRGQVVMAFID